MNILQVNTCDTVGGAAKIAWNLFVNYRTRGHRAWLAVSDRQSDDQYVLMIPKNACKSSWRQLRDSMGCLLTSRAGRMKLAGVVRSLFGRHIGRTLRRGHEDFNFPASWHLLDLPPSVPDILHGHNLHGCYFDLRALAWLSQQVPVILTLHDAWLLGGHCAHSFDCERWKTGCGECPDLTIDPAVQRDATADNWRRKRHIYAKSSLYVATPCRWLMGKVEQSILGQAILDAKVIPNGVDLSVFKAADRAEARRALGIPQEAKLLLSTAKGEGHNSWQDLQTIRDAVVQVAECLQGRRLQLIVLGREEVPARVGKADFHFLPYQEEAESMALYYQAADIYVHPARADTFPNTVLEALACGTAVVATAVGGIAEQVKGLRLFGREYEYEDFNVFGSDEATGILVRKGDARGIAKGIELLLTNAPLHRKLGKNAARDACERFDLNRQVDTYLDWYQTIIEGRNMTI